MANNQDRLGLVSVFKRRLSGGYTGIAPPVPIPNTEVKYTKADGSSFAVRVGRCHLSAFWIE